MHTVERLERALESARQRGFRIRHEWLGGEGGGACEFNGQRWIFIDLALDPAEQLDVVLEALGEEQTPATIDLPAADAPPINDEQERLRKSA